MAKKEISLLQAVEAAQQVIDQMKIEAQKADAGNSAAGTRLRGYSQDLRKHFFELRQLVLEKRKTAKKK